jgi:hypothetical protein
MSLIHNGMSHSHLLLNITTLYYIFFLWPDKKKTNRIRYFKKEMNWLRYQINETIKSNQELHIY